MKKIVLLLSMLLCILLAACSNDEVSPNDRFDTYVKNWNDKEFSKMYEMVGNKSKSTYPTEEFVDRYKKIYKDLGVTDLKITYEKLDEKEVEAALENGKATYPFSVEMNTIAGPITFDYEAKLVQQGEEEKKNWYVKWDPGFIFPALRDGGEIKFETEKPRRGEILDRNRMPLAINDTVWEIGIIPSKLGDSPEAMKKEIADLLGMDVETINSKLNANWVEPDLFVPITKVPTTNKNLEKLWATGAVSGKEVTGRVYPYGESTAHLVGYIAKVTAEDLKKSDDKTLSPNDMIGKRGLEKLYDKRLRGTEGIKISVKQEGEEDVVLAEQPVKDGENLTLTIDAEIQQKIYQVYDGEPGTTAAINPKTGEALALVSSPSFNPNEFVYGISQSRLTELQENPKQPLINKFSATYVPGSAIKPITASIGLQSGTLDPNKGVEINGLTWSPGEEFGNYEIHRVSESDGPVDLADALIRSDNIYFAMKALDMGSETFVNGLQNFGFGEEFPFSYPIQTSTVSTDGKLNDKVLLANTAYGQGEMQMSVLHLATAYTTFLNKGNMIKPILFKNEETGQVWKKDLITKDQATLIRDILRKVVTSPKGTAKDAQKADFPISGKTSTAELKKSKDQESGQENVWFVGYPSESQDILIAMMIEHAEDKNGSSYAVKKVTNILKEIK
ncbi:penicillin-binding transpeptidase domain-containing protein [Virgibacillus necropolis]|uniref:serine-type D-Ala-D-Ala carboxypeptidase n=1 Tax=Virgibacillus necropolis TaxID=163877 RepID=A0A221MAL5_9BACI|nr:penicillin-binding transpeptidase domain-containing protein [Virgibacillus necropolis]ASN04706.1 penicillin-binding protein [Virgibacillus necropolis]